MKREYKVLVAIWFLVGVNLLQANSIRQNEYKAFQSRSVESAIKTLFGNKKVVDDAGIYLRAPQLAENGGSVPLSVVTNIPAKRIAVLNDANPRALVALWHVQKRSVINYALKMKMRQTGMVTVIVEAENGNLYRARQVVEVSIGGCGGGGGSSMPSYTPPSSYVPQARHNYVPVQVTHNTSEYRYINENGFKEVSSSPLSTFSSDVDTASYSNIRRYLRYNQLPPRDAVRSEEMLNYFVYDYKEPQGKAPVYINTRVGDTLWNRRSKLIQIGLQSKKVDIEALPASNLVFLLDVSGSMNAVDKLPLLISSLKLLVKQLRAKDRVSIVVYAGSSGLVLDRARGDEKEKIYEALDRLNAGGSTAGGAGIRLAYDIARRAFIPEGNNRIILATDGDFNVGVSSESALVELIEKKRESGVFLSVLGFGSGNYKDNKMELLADKGNGNYAYIDTLLEAKKVLVTQMSGTLYTVAKDVKIQVEFNPSLVHSYRLVGYENRLLANEDFNNDKKDAGEMGMGHSVTVLYEIIPTSRYTESKVDKLKYQSRKRSYSNEIATVKVRYKDPKENRSKLVSKVISYKSNDIRQKDYDFAQSVAGFAMLLRKSEYLKGLNYAQLIDFAKECKGKDREGNRAEMIKLMESAAMVK